MNSFAKPCAWSTYSARVAPWGAIVSQVTPIASSCAIVACRSSVDLVSSSRLPAEKQMSSGSVRPISAAYFLAHAMADAHSSSVEISAVLDAVA